MFGKMNVRELRQVQPYFIYQRVSLAGAKGVFLFPIDYGFWFWLRSITTKHPEIDAAAANFAPELAIEIRESGSQHNPQDINFPPPPRLFTTPGSNGVQINAVGRMTATAPKNVKSINSVHIHRDNIEMYITGQNAIPFPTVIDVLLQGYLIPFTDLAMWKGTGK